MRCLCAIIALWLTVAVRTWAAELVPTGSEFQINTYTTGDQEYPAVAADGRGGFVVVWSSDGQDGHQDGVFGQRYRDGATAGSEFQVNTTTLSYQYCPAIAADRDGFVVVWMSYNEYGSDADIFARRYDETGAPLGEEFRTHEPSDDPQFTPAVALDRAGNFVVVWGSENQDGDAGGIFGRRYDRSGTPLGTEFQVNTYTTGAQSSPAVAADADDNVVVAWASAEQDGSEEGILAQRYDGNGGPLGTEFRVNTYTLGSQTHPKIAAEPAGGFLVVWDSRGQDGSGTGIFAQRYDQSAAPEGTEFQVNTFTSGNQAYPTVAVDVAGSILIAWHSSMPDQPHKRVAARLYDSAGAPAGTEIQVSSNTALDDSRPAAAATGEGQFVIAWEGNDQDGDKVGVFGQRLQTAPEQPLCVGDCGGDGAVTLPELIRSVNIALGNAPLADCPAIDANANGQVAINELIRAVGNALDGCAQV